MYSYWIKKKEKNMIYFASREQKYATIRKRTHQESFFLPTFLKKKKHAHTNIYTYTYSSAILLQF